jgi:hypothetical protein
MYKINCKSRSSTIWSYTSNKSGFVTRRLYESLLIHFVIPLPARGLCPQHRADLDARYDPVTPEARYGKPFDITLSYYPLHLRD